MAPSSWVGDETATQIQMEQHKRELQDQRIAYYNQDSMGHTPNPTVYRDSFAANLTSSRSQPNLSKSSPSQFNFRPAFLSPASRPTSSHSGSHWVPPSQPYLSSSSHSLDALARRSTPPLPAAAAAATDKITTTGIGLREDIPRTRSRTNIRPSTLLIRDSPSIPNLGFSSTPRTGSVPDLPALDSNEKTIPPDEKQHCQTPDANTHLPRLAHARYLTLACILLGLVGAALLCFTGVQETRSGLLNEAAMCLVLNEDWAGGALDQASWVREVELGGFGNGEFQMTTAQDKNVYVKNGQLYILPTLTSEEKSDWDQDGQTYVLDGCTATAAGGNSTNNNRRWLLPRQTRGGGRPTSTRSSSTPSTTSTANTTTSSNGASSNACVAKTNYALGTVINPVQSGRVSTKGKVGVRYGRVEVVAKVGTGDWLWPAIWMLPENNTYGPWPLSGEIDIMEARGNAPTYKAQGVNYVRSSLNFGLSKGLLPIAVQGGVQPEPLTKQLYGWFSLKRTSFDQAFHTYAVEWDQDFMRFYVDSRVKSTLQLKVKSGTGKNGKESSYFWDKGKFPPTAQNATDGQVVVVQNPWENGAKNAPFDQKFYLIIDHAVGGTSGWFPDEIGNKPWYDGSQTAMRDFAKAKDDWYSTWPAGEDDRAFRIKSVKMWSKECS